VTKIRSIAWPEDEETARRLFLNFAVQVTEYLGIEFPDIGPDPIIAARDYLDGKTSEKDYESSREPWFEFCRSKGFADQNRVRGAKVRLALYLTGVDPSEDLTEQLVWYHEFLEQVSLKNRELSNQFAQEFFEPYVVFLDPE